jgi:hypothetical protein
MHIEALDGVHAFGVAVKDVHTNKYNIDSLRQSFPRL